MFEKMKKILMHGDVPRVEKQAVQNIIEDDRKFVKIWSTIQLVYWGYCFIMSFRDEAFTRCRGAYIMAAILCLTALVFAIFLASKAFPLIPLSAFMVDAAMKESVSGANVTNTTNLRCEEIYHECSSGIVIMSKMSEIRLCSHPDDGFVNEECLPTLIVFDSLDGKVHPGEEIIRIYYTMNMPGFGLTGR